MSQIMLINAAEPDESRIVVLKDDVLQEFHTQHKTQETIVGNIYKGIVTNVEPSIQAAFVNLGEEKNGFLHISDIRSFSLDLFDNHKKSSNPPNKSKNEKDNQKKRITSIRDALRPGQNVVVQVARDAIGSKGPAVTMCLSIPGRFFVLMPGEGKRHISRKIDDETERERLRKILDELKIPERMGVIARTAAAGQTKRSLQQDLRYLLRLWSMIQSRAKKSDAPSMLYHESGLLIRTIRDIYTTDIEEIWIDSEEEYRAAREFMKNIMPRHVKRVKHYQGGEPLFDKYNVEQQIEEIYERKVLLPGGGTIVIEQTEALVAIDVNSGKFRQEKTQEETSTKINIEAAKEIARQLRLRDLGGVVVIDFIDMRESKNRHAVERALQEAFKNDRSRTKIGRISQFGLVEMTRQRYGSGPHSWYFEECSVCKGLGYIKSPESAGVGVLRRIKKALYKEDILEIRVRVAPRVAEFLLNERRATIYEIEQKRNVRISIVSDAVMDPSEAEVLCTCRNGQKTLA